MNAFTHFRRQAPPVQAQTRWFLPFLALFLLLYWWFAYQLERIDLRPILEPWWVASVPFLELPQFILFWAEMLHPRVLRHLIVPIVGWLLAHGAAISLVQVLYDLPDRPTAKRFLSRLQATTQPQGKPLKVSGKTLEKERENSELLRVGGPGKITIASGDVAVTELNGRFHRILKPGTHTLGRLEYIHAILDLRPQERVITGVPLITRDGIEITADITVTFRLDTGGDIPTKAQPYPFDEEAVRLAAYNVTVLPGKKISAWDNTPTTSAKSGLTKIIAHYRLDELLYARAAAEPYQAIRTELIQKTRPFLANLGIELTNLHISRLEMPENVTNQYIKYWQTHWETQVKLQQVDGRAIALEEVEIAHAEAEMTMIQAIVEGVQRARQISNVNNMHEIIALRLVEALEKMAKESQKEIPLPLTMLPQINTLRQQLQSGSAPSNTSGTATP